MKSDIALGQLINFFPAPVVLVASKSKAGKNNVMTAAWFGVACSVPPMLAVSIRPGRLSNENIKETKEFSVNIPQQDFLEKIDLIGTKSGNDLDKFSKFNLGFEEGKTISAPLLADCPVNYECKLKQIVSLGTHDLFLGEVSRAVMDEGFDFSKFRPVSMIENHYYGIGKKIGDYGFSKGAK